MSRIYATPLLDAIVASLRDVGPQTRVELAEHLGKPSPVWTLQTSKHAGDAPRPEPETRKQINARWRANHAAALRAKRRSAASPWEALLPPGAKRT